MLNVINYGDKNYPPALKEIPNPPLKFYFKGGSISDSRPHIAIVGTRKATSVGKEIAKKFARELASAGAVIVSGLAMGIDTAAHEGALDGKGKTIAVLANGLDWVYPRQNENLAKKILESGGALFSEYPAGTPTLKNHFLERNRLVSGLCLGTILIEAPEGSGALVTANFALEQNRDVFVVPGPINNENYAGSHALLRAGARLVTKPTDVLEDLNLTAAVYPQQQLPMRSLELDEKQRAILTVLQKAGEPLSIDKMEELTRIDVSAINRSLTFLLIQGLIKEGAGRYYI